MLKVAFLMNFRDFLLSSMMFTYIARSSEVFHILKRNTTRFGINKLSFDGGKLWSKFYFELLNKETNLTKSNFKT